jgi:hypothetical protein
MVIRTVLPFIVLTVGSGPEFAAVASPLRIVVKDDIIDTCIDQRRTMITRRIPEPGGDRLCLFAQDGEVTFDKIVVRPLCR